MTGGGEHCWQQQQQHVIWEWTTSRRLRLNPNLCSETFSLWWKQYHQSRAVCVDSILNRCTGWHKGRPTPIWRWSLSEEAVSRVTSSFYRRLPNINVGLRLLVCDWRPCRLCFPSRAIIGQCVSKGTSVSGSVFGLARTCSCYIYVRIYCLSLFCTVN